MGRKLTAVVLALGSVVAGLLGISATPASAATGSPVGTMNDASARWDFVSVISGTASDPDAPGTPVTVRFSVAPNAPYLGPSTTTTTAPGVTGPVSWSIDTKMLGVAPMFPPSTPSVICAWAVNVGPGTDTLLGCRTHPVFSQSAFDPLGSLDSVSVAPGLIQVRGWAGDPDGDRTTQIRIAYGRPDVNGLPTGGLEVEQTAGLPRPDVAAVYPAVGSTTGFNFTLPMAPGPVSVCISAQNTGLRGLRNTLIKCTTRNVPGPRPLGPHDPRGFFDSFTTPPTASGPIDEYTARGWAYDPDTSGRIGVTIRMVGDRIPGTFEMTEVFQKRTLSTGKPRPSVQAAFPAAGPNAGFSGVVGTSSTNPVRLACAYAVDVGPGSTSFLGCKSLL
jgi:hypothetical protein